MKYFCSAFTLALLASTAARSNEVNFLPATASANAHLEDSEFTGQTARMQARRAARRFVQEFPVVSQNGGNTVSTATAVAHATTTYNPAPTSTYHPSATLGSVPFRPTTRPQTMICCDACPIRSTSCHASCIQCGSASNLRQASSSFGSGVVDALNEHYVGSRTRSHGAAGINNSYQSTSSSRASARASSASTNYGNAEYGGARRPSTNYGGAEYGVRRPTLGPRNRGFSTEICCADCPAGDIGCYSSCNMGSCVSVTQCAAAGEGVYAAFCQERCASAINGFSTASLQFLPEPACRGFCAANVQELCEAKACSEFGCLASDCLARAPQMCGHH